MAAITQKCYCAAIHFPSRPNLEPTGANLTWFEINNSRKPIAFPTLNGLFILQQQEMVAQSIPPDSLPTLPTSPSYDPAAYPVSIPPPVPVPPPLSNQSIPFWEINSNI